MTKDQPRNRSGGSATFSGKSSGFRGKPGSGGKPRAFSVGQGAPRDGNRPPPKGGWNGRRGTAPHGADRREAAFEEGGEVWIWGLHAAGAALINPRRQISEALLTRNAANRAGLDPDAPPAFVTIVEPRIIDHRLPAGAVHQGIALRCAPLEPDTIDDAVLRPERPLVILDQVTDPQNVGAVFRSAAAFGFGGVVMQTRNAPLLGGALAKAAAGAVETIAEIRAVNLSRAIDVLRDAGWRVVGLDGPAEATVAEAFRGDEPLAIVMGAEGDGIRQGVAAACTQLARIPIHTAMESLNVSNAAAIAFYEASRRTGAPAPPPNAARRRRDADDGEAV